MHASNPKSSTTARHFSGPPAIPTTRAPAILAIWPATDPVAPAAADTTTVSPGWGRPMPAIPKYAVAPVGPYTDITASWSSLSGPRPGTGVVNRSSRTIAYSWNPVSVVTTSP